MSEDRIAAVAAELGDVEIRRTEHPGHVTALAREARARPALYVFSGDGGYNEALNGLDADVPVGFIPGGGANVLLRASASAARSDRSCASDPGKPHERRISLGRVNKGRRFAFPAGVGLSAEVVRRVDRRGRTEEGGRAGNAMFAWTVRKPLHSAGDASSRPSRSQVGAGRLRIGRQL